MNHPETTRLEATELTYVDILYAGCLLCWLTGVLPCRCEARDRCSTTEAHVRCAE